MWKERKWKITFNIDLGQLEYLVMPFDSTKRPADFQVLVKDVLYDFINLFITVFLDDILIFSKSVYENESHVCQIQRIRIYCTQPNSCAITPKITQSSFCNVCSGGHPWSKIFEKIFIIYCFSNVLHFTALPKLPHTLEIAHLLTDHVFQLQPCGHCFVPWTPIYLMCVEVNLCSPRWVLQLIFID